MQEIPIVATHFTPDEERELIQALHSGWVGQGPRVEALEVELSKRYDGAHCIAMHSCTGALHLALLSIDIGPGDCVAVPGFTFVATANAVAYCGATPVMVDVDPDTFNMNPKLLAEQAQRLGKKLKAVMLVHEFGLCADIDAIRKAMPAGCELIEDAACAFGSGYKGKAAGMFGKLSCFSMHPRKVITCGEGGFVITADKKLADRCRRLRNHGLDASLDVPELGYNQRMTDLQAALAIHQVRRGDSFATARRQKAAFYDTALVGIPELLTPHKHADYLQNYQSYVVRLRPSWLKANDEGSLRQLAQRRDRMIKFFADEKIGVRFAAYAISTLSYYRNKFGTKAMDCPGSLLSAVSTIALPIFPDMDEAQQQRVVATMKRAMALLHE